MEVTLPALGALAVSLISIAQSTSSPNELLTK
jgi:hypothetical protein